MKDELEENEVGPEWKDLIQLDAFLLEAVKVLR